MTAATVSVTLPGLLARFTGGRRTVTVTADTIGDCIDTLVETHPAIEPHVFDGAGGLRTHVRLYHNGRGVDWPAAESVELEPGDEVIVLQAVSGG